MRIAFVWFLLTLRRSPAVLIRCWIASVRLATPSGNVSSSLFCDVRFASAFAGTYFFPLASFLSIWHDIPLSLPLPRCRWQTAYCVLLISVRYFTMILIVKSRPMCHKQLGVERTSLPLWVFDCWTRSGGGENALINYGILQTLFSRTASCPIHPIIISVLHPPIPTQVRQSMSASRGYGQSSVEVSSEGCPPSEGSPQCPILGHVVHRLPYLPVPY